MTPFHTRCAAYALMALVALVGTVSQLPQYLPLGLVQDNVQFWSDTLANPASRFITIDVLVVFLVVWPWMIGEARRWRMGGLPAYSWAPSWWPSAWPCPCSCCTVRSRCNAWAWPRAAPRHARAHQRSRRGRGGR